jgi:hypothetical protein
MRRAKVHRSSLSCEVRGLDHERQQLVAPSRMRREAGGQHEH